MTQMIQPFTVTVARELGNSGDVITTVRDSAGTETKLVCPGDCSPYSALHAIREGLEKLLNNPIAMRAEDWDAELASRPVDSEGDAS